MSEKTASTRHWLPRQSGSRTQVRRSVGGHLPLRGNLLSKTKLPTFAEQNLCPFISVTDYYPAKQRISAYEECMFEIPETFPAEGIDFQDLS